MLYKLVYVSEKYGLVWFMNVYDTSNWFLEIHLITEGGYTGYHLVKPPVGQVPGGICGDSIQEIL